MTSFLAGEGGYFFRCKMFLDPLLKNDFNLVFTGGVSTDSILK